jgi:hypothetical protein
MAPSPYICSGILEAEVITTLPGCRVQDDGIPAIQVCAVQPMQEDAVACLYVREDRCVLRLPLSITRADTQVAVWEKKLHSTVERCAHATNDGI